MPRFGRFADPAADFWVLVTRIALGAMAGALFHSQVLGPTAAIAVGASAPALLAQFGNESVPGAGAAAVRERIPAPRSAADIASPDLKELIGDDSDSA